MIGYLQGEVLESAEGKMIIGVGNRDLGSVVGYQVCVPQSSTYLAFLPNQKIQLYIYTHVREEALDLYGFSSKSEKLLFLTLLGVNGIGPKSALGILSAIEPSQLIQAIVQGDKGLLTQLPGIGKKTAERVIVELRDSIQKKLEAGAFHESSEGKAVAQEGPNKKVQGPTAAQSHVHAFYDAKAALLGLGYRDSDIHALLHQILERSEIQVPKAEDLVRAALRQLG